MRATEKAHKLEEEGDALVAAGHYAEAMVKYRESEMLDNSRVVIYEKLITTREKLDTLALDEWQQDDMTEILEWTMRVQELATPRLRYLHQHLSGDDKEIETLIQQLMMAQDEMEEGRFLTEIEAYGDRAVRPLLHFFLSFKHHQPTVKK